MGKVERNYEGLKVLDFTRVLVGPYLTQILCDMGAEVIKIERPFVGADERHFAPIYEGADGMQSGYFMMLSRGKKSLTLNLKDPECKEIIHKLMKWADVICENFAPGVMKRLGLDFEVAKQINPGVVYCSMSVFGQEGPYSNLPGYDIIAQAMSGLLWLTGEADGVPMRSGTAIGDVNATGYALGAIGAALHYKYRTGQGQHIDISLRDLLSSELETAIVRYTQSQGKDVPMRSGSYHETIMPYGVFDAGRGKYIVLVAINPNHWEDLCKVMGKEEWGAQEKFNDSSKRATNQKEVIQVIEEWLQSFENYQDAVRALQEVRVPAAPVLDIPELLQDPQWRMRNNLVKIEDPIFGPIELPATPLVFSKTSTFNNCPPPTLGEHTSEVLRDILHIPEERITAIIHKYGGK